MNCKGIKLLILYIHFIPPSHPTYTLSHPLPLNTLMLSPHKLLLPRAYAGSAFLSFSFFFQNVKYSGMLRQSVVAPRHLVDKDMQREALQDKWSSMPARQGGVGFLLFNWPLPNSKSIFTESNSISIAICY